MVHSHQIHPVLHITQIHNRIILFPLWDLEWKCRSILLINACDLPIFVLYRVAGGRDLGWVCNGQWQIRLGRSAELMSNKSRYQLNLSHDHVPIPATFANHGILLLIILGSVKNFNLCWTIHLDHHVNPDPESTEFRIQGWAKFAFPGLVNFVPAVAYNFCLNLP